MTGRITWHPADSMNPGAMHGYAGTGEHGSLMFMIGGYVNFHLHSLLPGLGSRDAESRDPDDLKAIAEEWLAGFVTGLGAVFLPVGEHMHVRGDGYPFHTLADWKLNPHQHGSDIAEPSRCGECFSVHPKNPGPDGDSCAAHGHCYIPREHPERATSEHQDWWGCPHDSCTEGRWVS